MFDPDNNRGMTYQTNEKYVTDMLEYIVGAVKLTCYFLNTLVYYYVSLPKIFLNIYKIGQCPKRVGSFGYDTDFRMRKSMRSDIDSVRKL